MKLNNDSFKIVHSYKNVHVLKNSTTKPSKNDEKKRFVALLQLILRVSTL